VSSVGIATLFDFNGVLIDDELVHFAAFRDVVQPLGIDLTREAYDERYLGYDDAGAFKAMLVDAGKTPSAEEIARLIEAKKPVYMARIATELKIFDGAKDIVLRRAALGVVGIVSGALRHEIEHALGVMGVRDHVAFIVSAEDTTECKPHPEGYLLGLRALARAADGVAVIEDSLAGVAAAKHAKLRCAAVAHSYPADRLTAAGADAVAATIAELTDAMIDG
jgi:beta-phosphoglucomutase